MLHLFQKLMFAIEAVTDTAYNAAEEIWGDTGGNPNIRIIAVEPEDSQVLSGDRPSQHLIEGISTGFIPSLLDSDLIDEVIPIANETAFPAARRSSNWYFCRCSFGGSYRTL